MNTVLPAAMVRMALGFDFQLVLGAAARNSG